MGSEVEQVNPDAQDGLVEASEEAAAAPSTAAAKILSTLRELSQPDEDAGELELTLATVCMGLERGLKEQIFAQQETGELDAFVLALTRFLALHRSDSARRLVVVEIPRRDRPLPSGTRLHLLDEAIEAADRATSPL